MTRTPYIVGPPIKLPDDFYGRSRQTGQFFATLAAPQAQCVSVLGLRRAGKTSFLQHISHPRVMAAHVPDADRYVMVYIDVSTCKTAADFYTRVYNKLLNSLPRGAAGAGPTQTTADVYMVESLLYKFKSQRVVFLLDEFDQLRSAEYGEDFLVELRALAGVWDYELAYVTASYWDLFRLGKFVGLPPTSPFFNIFYPTPIYLSGLGPTELNDLVRIPARRVGVAPDDEDVAYIRRLAGTLPFFLQAVAMTWLTHKQQNRSSKTREAAQQLVAELGPFFEQWVRNFSDIERDVILAAAREQPLSRLPYAQTEIDEIVTRLANYGILATAGGSFGIDSHLFTLWLQENEAQVRRVQPVPSLMSPFTAASGRATADPAPVDESFSACLVGTIDAAARMIERDPDAHRGKSDKMLRDALLSVLRANQPNLAPGRLFSAAGETGILTRSDGRELFIAECRSWRGQKPFLQSIDSLLRSLDHGDSCATAVSFLHGQELSLVINAIIQALPHHPAYLGFEGYRSGSHLAFRFRSRRGPQREISLSVLLVAFPA